MYFEIRENWSMSLLGCRHHEYYFNIRQNPNQVKKYIKEWIESWKENAEENEYKFLGFKTDYKTFAKCRIKKEENVDNFIIKVIKRRGKKKNDSATSMNYFKENMDKEVK